MDYGQAVTVAERPKLCNGNDDAHEDCRLYPSAESYANFPTGATYYFKGCISQGLKKKLATRDTRTF